MPIVKVRGKGQLTIPLAFRRELKIGENDAVNMIKAGGVLVLAPRRLPGDTISERFERTMKKRGITLNDLLVELKAQRAKYNPDTNELEKK